MDARVKADKDVKAEDRRLDRIEYGITASWEIDFFGRLGNTRRARAADRLSREHALAAARLALTASVAEAYYGVIEQRLLLRLLAQQEKAVVDYVAIIQSRYDQGLISKIDLLQQQGQLADIRSLVPDAESNLRTQENLVNTLLGAGPGSARPAEADPAFPILPSLPSLGRPDDLLKKRPDLLAQQADLVAADAEIGRAISERLPRLVFGLDALRVAGRTSEDPLITAAGTLVQPLLDWGSRRAEVARTKGVYTERLAVFSQTFLDAVFEVENTVYRESRQKELLLRLEERRQLLQASLDQARQRYVAGLTDYLPVLTSLQQLYTVEQRLIREQRRLVSFRIALHRALGGPVPATEVAPAK
jgi:outer membrane protein TolC